MSSPYPEEVVSRFWDKVEILKPNKCWLWKAGTYKEGYGQFKSERSSTGRRSCIGAHRFSLELKLGKKLSFKTCALHTCDNRLCVNPLHLFPGTKKQNTQDMIQKGHARVQSLLIKEDIIEIRQRCKDYRHGLLSELAREFGVSINTIRSIRNRKIHRNVK